MSRVPTKFVVGVIVAISILTLGLRVTTARLSSLSNLSSSTASTGDASAGGGVLASANPAGNLDHVRNGSAGSPVSPGEWSNGNAGASNAHYLEGYSIPYRLKLTDLAPGAHNVKIEWDIRQNSKNAIDYITHFNRINDPSHMAAFGHAPETIDPTIGIAGLGAPSAFPIPDPTLPFTPDVPAAQRVMTIYNGTITGMSYDFEGSLVAAKSATRLSINFTTSNSTVVLAWGGHIARRQDWGAGSSAGGIEGAPYHTRFVELDGKGGNQDRSLMADAVLVACGTCNVNGPTPVCAGETNTYTSSITGVCNDASHSWSIVGNGTIVGSSAGASVQVQAGDSAGTYTITDTITCKECVGPHLVCSKTVTVDKVAFTTSKTDPSCNGASDGGITVTTTSGVAPFTFSKDGGLNFQSSNVFTGLAAGTYDIVVRDANECTASSSVTINQPTVLSLQLSAVEINCNSAGNGSITANFSGGTPNYMIKLDNGSFTPGASPFTFNNVGPGQHTVTLKDANECSTSQSVTINEPPALSLNLEKTDVTCNGASNGKITATFSGGEGQLMLKLDNGAFAPATSPITFNNVTPGAHTVTLKDANECATSQQITINEPPALTLSLDKTDSVCNGANNGSITATFGGGAGSYMIKLDNGSFAAATSPVTFNNLAPGPHTVTVKDANECATSKSVTINEPSAVALSLMKTDVTCNGAGNGSITATFSGGAPNYMIKLDDGSFAAATSPVTFNNVGPGLHTVTLKDANECQTSKSVNLDNPPAVTLSLMKTDITCNGAGNGVITATFGGGTGTYMIKLDGGSFAAATSPFTFNNVGPGTHTVTVKDANECAISKPITINEPSVVTLSLAKTDVLCNGANNGAITAMFGGGTGTYMIKLDGGSFVAAMSPFTFNNLGPGSHTVMVKDANECMASQSVTISQPAVLACNINSPAQPPLCGSTGNTLTASAMGGTPPYSFTWSLDAAAIAAGWSITGGQGTNMITYTAGSDGAPATFTLMVTDGNRCVSMCSIQVRCKPPETEFCSLTQGAYGNRNGRFNGVRRDQLIMNLLNGTPLVVGKTGARSITFANNSSDTASCIIGVMPAGGPASALPSGFNVSVPPSACGALSPLLNRNGRFNNVLIGQVLALSLNVRLDPDLNGLDLCSVFVTRRALPGPDGILGNSDDVVDPSDPGQTFTIPSSVITALCNLGLPLTVNGLLELANRGLAGQPTGGASLSNINSAVDAINSGFDECRFITRCAKASCGDQ